MDLFTSLESALLSQYQSCLLDADHDQISWALPVIEDWLDPTFCNGFLLPQVQPTVDGDNTLYNARTEGHQTPDDAQILFGKGPFRFVLVDHFIGQVSCPCSDEIPIDGVIC